MTSDAAWAELIRAENLRTEHDLDLLRMPLWVCRFPHAGLLDMTSTEVQAIYEVTDDLLTSDDWTICQRVGRQVRSSCAGVIAPCVALEGHANVTLFGARRKIDWRMRPALARTTPAGVVALGRPAEGLLPRVRRPSVDSVPSLF